MEKHLRWMGGCGHVSMTLHIHKEAPVWLGGMLKAMGSITSKTPTTEFAKGVLGQWCEGTSGLNWYFRFTSTRTENRYLHKLFQFFLL